MAHTCAAYVRVPDIHTVFHSAALSGPASPSPAEPLIAADAAVKSVSPASVSISSSFWQASDRALSFPPEAYISIQASSDQVRSRLYSSRSCP